MATHLASHWSGAWRYTFHVPRDLRALVGGKTAFRRYIPRCTRKEAERQARRWALDDTAEIDALRALPDADKAALSGRDWHAEVNLVEPEPRTIANENGRTLTIGADPKEQAIYRAAAFVERKLNPLASQHSFDSLFNEWVRIRTPSKPRNHLATIGLLKTFPDYVQS